MSSKCSDDKRYFFIALLLHIYKNRFQSSGVFGVPDVLLTVMPSGITDFLHCELSDAAISEVPVSFDFDFDFAFARFCVALARGRAADTVCDLLSFGIARITTSSKTWTV